MEAILDQLKAAESSAVASEAFVVVEIVPNVARPLELGTAPDKTKTLIANALTAIGKVVTRIGAFLSGLDWRVKLFICAIISGFAVYANKRRFVLFKAVKHPSNEFA